MKKATRAHPGNLAPARWLVLGAAGFVGRATMARLQPHSRQTTGAGRSATPPAGVAGKSWQVVDVFDSHGLRTLLRKLQPTILLNAVGHSPAVAGSGLQEFYGRSTETILAAVQAESPACRVVLLGSAAEYGNSPEAGSAETDIPHPLSDYGRAKCRQFDAARAFAANGLDIITARLFNPLGPGQGRQQFVGALWERIRRGERPVRVRSGNHIRDWMDVRDAADALVRLAESPAPPAVVNICTGQGHTVEFVARAVSRLAGVEVEAEPGETSPDVLWRSIGNPGRIFSLGWQPQYSLDECLAGLWPSVL